MNLYMGWKTSFVCFCFALVVVALWMAQETVLDEVGAKPEEVRCFAAFGGENRVSVTMAIVSVYSDLDVSADMKVYLQDGKGELKLIKGKRQRLTKVASEYAESLGGSLYSVFVEVYFVPDEAKEEDLALGVSPITGNLIYPSGIRLKEAGSYMVTFDLDRRGGGVEEVTRYEFNVHEPHYMNSNALVIEKE